MKYFVFKVDEPLHFVNIGHYTSDKNWQHNHRVMSDYEVFIVLGGNVFIEQDGEKFAAPPKNMVLNIPFVPHGGYKPSFADFFWFHFTCKTPHTVLTETQLRESLNQDADAFASHVILPQQFEFANWENITLLMGRLFNMCHSGYSQTATDYMVTSTLLEITQQVLDRFAPPKSQHNTKLNAILAYIDANKHQRMTVQEVAEAFSYNEKYLSSLFVKKLGISPKNYITQQRMELAKSILRYSTDKIKDIALYCSYEDERLFMRVFKQYVGMTPTQYRDTFKR